MPKLLLFSICEDILPPLGILYIASYLREYLGWQDISVETAATDQLQRIKQHRPDIVGFTSVTRDWKKVSAVAKQVKEELAIPCFVGGHHISAIPHTLPSWFDFAVIGEGEETTLEVLKDFRKTGKLTADSLDGVLGVAYHSNGKVAINPRRPPIKSLDKVPFPARDLVDMESRLRPTRDFFPIDLPPMRFTSMSSSRGCPYSCSFCSSSAFWNGYRTHSPEYVVSEIKKLYNTYRPDAIMINDDLFAASKPRLRSIVGLLKAEGLHNKIRFWVNARANILDDEICRLLKEMNAWHLMMGFESFSERPLNYLKASVTVEQNKNALILAKRHDFFVEGGIIVGSPGETKEDMIETYKYLKSSPIDCFGAQVATPLPGSPLWEEAKAQGKVSDEMDFEELFTFGPYEYLENAQRYEKTLMTQEMTPQEFLQIYRRFVELQYELGSYIGKIRLRHLVRSFFKEQAFFGQLVRMYLNQHLYFKHPRIYRSLKTIARFIKR